MANALYVLRNFVLNGRLSEVIEDGDHIVFGEELRVPSDTKTVYKDKSQDEYVTIMSAMLLAKNKVRYQYIAEMAKRKLAKFLGHAEMKDLLEFLTGQTERSAAGNIHLSQFEDAGVPGGGSLAGAREGTSGHQPSSKRQRMAGESRDASSSGGAAPSGKAGSRREGAAGGALSKHGGKAGGACGGGGGGGVDKGQVGMEVTLVDRNSALLTPGHDFTFALRAYEEAHAKAPSSAASAGGVPSSPSSAASPKHGSGSGGGAAAADGRGGASSSSAGQKSKPTSASKRSSVLPPIIIVPSATSSLVTLLNVKRFLADGEFKTVAELKLQGVGKEPKLKLTHNAKEYVVMDNPSRLKDSDWDRVVAVVVMGKEWQFKDWKWSSPVDLFSKVLGVYVKWDSEAVPADTVAKWNVKVLDVSKNKRHLDPTSRIKFWQMFDEYVRVNKPHHHR